ncbi:HSP7F [Enterospora canceri]|uniref:HSP7F n=1 Tax=Enterospora canceri TaxID=1081671 RepID=A0A1Y1S7X2_9MICR|nr:HSP7F [Enterospora canceri]
MHKIGIDIGNTKTVIYSSKQNGTVVTDEYDKREIATVLELTKPKRSYGKGCSSDGNESILVRFRSFMSQILTEEGRLHLYMFLEQLHRILELEGGYKGVALTIPEYFGSQEKGILLSLTRASNLRVVSFVTQLTAVASYAGLLTKTVPDNFMLMDFGSHKSTIGIFAKKDGRVTPLARFYCKRGATDFDEAIYRMVVEKYNLSNSKVIKERIFQQTEKIKKAFNNFSEISVTILDDTYQNIQITVSREELYERVKIVIEEIAHFVSSTMKDTAYDGHIEIVGKNSQNKFIKDITKNFTCYTTLHTSEAAAHGACLYLAVNSNLEMKYKVDEIIGREITAKIGEESFIVFRSNDLINKKRKIKVQKSGEFVVELHEDGILFGTITVKNTEELAETEAVSIEVVFDEFCLFKVNSAKIVDINQSTESIEKVRDGQKVLEFVFDTFTLDTLETNMIVQKEQEFATIEENYKKAGEIRNETEQVLDNLAGYLESKFSNLATSEDVDKINALVDEYFSLDITRDYEIEKKRAEEYYGKLGFIREKLEEREKDIAEAMTKIENEMKDFIGKNKKDSDVMIPMHKLATEIKKFKENMALKLNNLGGFDHIFASEAREKFEEAKKEVEQLIVKKREREEKRKNEEIKRKEEERKREEAKKRKEEEKPEGEDTEPENTKAESDAKESDEDQPEKKGSETDQSSKEPVI